MDKQKRHEIVVGLSKFLDYAMSEEGQKKNGWDVAECEGMQAALEQYGSDVINHTADKPNPRIVAVSVSRD